MKVRAAIESIPPDDAGGYDLPTREAVVDVDTFADGMTALRGQVDDGERLITVRVTS